MHLSRQEEAAYFEAFLAVRRDLIFESVEHEDKPDFRGQRGSSRIGVEVTRFSPTRRPGYPIPEEQESLQRWTMDMARATYQAGGGGPIHVSAMFNNDVPLTKKRAGEVAKEIANFLLAETRPLLIYQQSEFDTLFEDAFIPELGYLSAVRVASEDETAWSAGYHGWVRHADAHDIHRVLEGKEKRVELYREACDELWLLIVFDVSYGSIADELPTDPVEFVIPTGFDRIFCLSPAGPRCVEVPVISSTSTE